MERRRVRFVSDDVTQARALTRPCHRSPVLGRFCSLLLLRVSVPVSRAASRQRGCAASAAGGDGVTALRAPLSFSLFSSPAPSPPPATALVSGCAVSASATAFLFSVAARDTLAVPIACLLVHSLAVSLNLSRRCTYSSVCFVGASESRAHIHRHAYVITHGRR